MRDLESTPAGQRVTIPVQETSILAAETGHLKMALIYARVSTRRQKMEGTGLDSQVSACTAHAETLGYEVGRITREVFSGAELFDRPQLARDRADIRAGVFDAVIVHSIDRLSRDEAHLAIITSECEEVGCRLISVTEESRDIEVDESSRSEDMRYAERERRKISERTQRGRMTKLRQGKPSFRGWDLYGYRPDRTSNTYKIEEREAEVVRRIFCLCAGGRGMHSIASLLNREGIPSPKSGRVPGARWSSGTISRILNTRSYIGEEYCQKTRREGTKKREVPRPESEWIRLPDGIRPPLISREIWEECQRKICTRAQKMNNNGSKPALLKGHLFCASCGARMIRNHFRRGKYEYEKYRCGSRWRPFDTGCQGEGVTVSLIDVWIWAEIKRAFSAPSVIERALEEVVKTESASHLAYDIQIAKREIACTESVLEDLHARLKVSADDHILKPYVEREMHQAHRKKQNLQRMIADIERRISEANSQATDLSSLRDRALIIRDPDEFTFDERRLALRALGLKVFANGDEFSRWRYEINLPIG